MSHFVIDVLEEILQHPDGAPWDTRGKDFSEPTAVLSRNPNKLWVLLAEWKLDSWGPLFLSYFQIVYGRNVTRAEGLSQQPHARKIPTAGNWCAAKIDVESFGIL